MKTPIDLVMAFARSEFPDRCRGWLNSVGSWVWTVWTTFFHFAAVTVTPGWCCHVKIVPGAKILCMFDVFSICIDDRCWTMSAHSFRLVHSSFPIVIINLESKVLPHLGFKWQGGIFKLRFSVVARHAVRSQFASRHQSTHSRDRALLLLLRGVRPRASRA